MVYLLVKWLHVLAAISAVGANGFGYTPTLKRQIDVLEREGVDSASYKEVAARGTTFGIVLAVLAMIVVFLMVVKPRLWA